MILAVILAIGIPISLVLWLTSVGYSFISGDYSSYIAAWRWLVAIFASLLLAWYGLRKKSLDKSGAVADHNSDDDFQPNQTYEERLESAIADIGLLRNYSRPAKRSRTAKQKPGPKAKVVRLRFYLLPDGSDLPKFTKPDPLIERHQNLGYGFPVMYYSNFKGKNHPVALHLSEDELKEMLQSLFPKLMNKTFNLYTQNQRRKLTEAPFHPQHFKDLKYQGVVIIKIQDATGNLVNPTNSLTVPTSTAAIATSTQPSTSRPVSVSTPARPVPISTPARPVPVSTPARPVPVSTPARPVPVSTPARPVPVSTPARPVPVSTPATPVLAPSPTTTEHELTQATPNHQTWISSGTPVVTFNPRQHLVNEQDIDFASSLAADREKEESRQAARARRTLERTERTRQREQRKEAIEQLQIKAVGDLHILFITSLAEDHVSLVFVLPDQTVLEKTVSKKTSSETLHLYVEACTDVVLAKLVYCGQLLVREDSTIESLGITGNSRIIVEENLEEILDDSSSEEEPEDSEPINLLNVNGIVVGFLLTISNLCFFTSLLTFFLLASKATKYKSLMKKKLEEDFKEGGQRNWVQVICNGGIASMFAMIYMLDNGVGEMPVDFSKRYTPSFFSMAVLGALACSCGDTFASELGTVFKYNTQPRLITTFRKVPKGTNGGVSLVGTLCSLIGGLVVGVAYYLTLIFSLSDVYLQKCPPQWPIILLGTIAGVLGSTIDSYLGAIFQYSGYNKVTHKIVETEGKNVEYICGWSLLDNHSVNLLSSLFCGLLTPKVAFYLWWLLL